MHFLERKYLYLNQISLYVATGLVVSKTALAQEMAQYLAAITWTIVDQDVHGCQFHPRKNIFSDIWIKIQPTSFKETRENKVWKNNCHFFPTSIMAASWFAPSQWETVLLCNDVSHWLGASLESALLAYLYFIPLMKMYYAISSKCQWNSLVHPSIGTWTSIVH